MVRSMAKSSCACWKAASFWRSCCKERWNARRVFSHRICAALASLFLPEQCGTSLQQNADQPIAAIIDNAFQCLLQAGAGFGGHMHKFGL